MKRSNYYEKFKDPRWQKIRLKVFERAEWRCQSCGSGDRELHVHHGYYEWGIEPWDLPIDTIWCLCDLCHERHQAELRDLKLEIGRTNPADYNEIMTVIHFERFGHEVWRQTEQEEIEADNG